MEGFWIWDNGQNTIKTVNVNSAADCLAQCADTDGCSSSSVEYIKSSNNHITSRSCRLGKRRNGYMLFPQKNYISANMYCQCKSFFLTSLVGIHNLQIYIIASLNQ